MYIVEYLINTDGDWNFPSQKELFHFTNTEKEAIQLGDNKIKDIYENVNSNKCDQIECVRNAIYEDGFICFSDRCYLSYGNWEIEISIYPVEFDGKVCKVVD